MLDGRTSRNLAAPFAVRPAGGSRNVVLRVLGTLDRSAVLLLHDGGSSDPQEAENRCAYASCHRHGRIESQFGYGGWVRLEHHKPCCARMMIDDKFFRGSARTAGVPCWDTDCERDLLPFKVLLRVLCFVRVHLASGFSVVYCACDVQLLGPEHGFVALLERSHRTRSRYQSERFWSGHLPCRCVLSQRDLCVTTCFCGVRWLSIGARTCCASCGAV